MAMGAFFPRTALHRNGIGRSIAIQYFRSLDDGTRLGAGTLHVHADAQPADHVHDGILRSCLR
jgi:hypothetical protein